MEEYPPAWTYYPNIINSECFDYLLPIFTEACRHYYYQTSNGIYESRKVSCVYRTLDSVEIDAGRSLFSYDDIPTYDWSDGPQLLIDIRDYLSNLTGFKFDYVLVHIYRGPKDCIGWHNDKEALTSEIVSVSLGAPRKFRFRPLHHAKGYTHEYLLKSGDVIHMWGPRYFDNGNIVAEATGEPLPSCQEIYKHTLPEMNVGDMIEYAESCGVKFTGRRTFTNLYQLIEDNDITPVRINLTFRQYT